MGGQIRDHFVEHAPEWGAAAAEFMGCEAVAAEAAALTGPFAPIVAPVTMGAAAVGFAVHRHN